MKRNKWSLVLPLFLTLILAFSSSAFAFSDLQGVAGSDQIIALQKSGIVSGIKPDLFGPNQGLTVAQGVFIIVKGLDLNIDNIRFIKIPKASDSFTKVPDDAWYANAFIMAQLNGLELPREIDPHALMTREQFAHYLFKGLERKGDYAFIEMYVLIADEAEINPAYMNDIQKLLIAHIAALDKSQNFYPKNVITRAEAAVMLSNTINFLKNIKPIPPLDEDTDHPGIDKKVTMVIDKVSNDVNKVTIAWGEKPNPGYTISIDVITFNENNEAVITYTLHYPDPDKMYTQVITNPSAATYVSSHYKVVIEKSGSQSIKGSLGETAPPDTGSQLKIAQ